MRFEEVYERLAASVGSRRKRRRRLLGVGNGSFDGNVGAMRPTAWTG